MNLGDQWEWDKRKLACRIRPESGNPAMDELRQRLSELTGVAVPDSASIAAAGKKPHGAGKKSLSKSKRHTASIDMDKPRPATVSSHALGASRALLASHDDTKVHAHQMNINKRFFKVPRSPPVKIITDFQQELLKSATMGSVTFDETLHGNGEPATTSPKSAERRYRRSQRGKMGKRAPEPKEAPPLDTSGSSTGKPFMFKPYQGDVFGTGGNYMGGMVYLSRMPAPDGALLSRTKTRLAPGVTAAPGASTKPGKGPEPGTMEQSIESLDLSSSKSREAKVHCAKTLAGWAQHAANTERLANEGAVEAIMFLSKEEDPDLRRHCSLAVKLMSTRRLLAQQLVANSAVSTLAHMAAQAKEARIASDCAAALVNLSRMDGFEARLVEEGIVLALMTLMNAREELAVVCAKGLFNLTCVNQSYTYIERVIKSFVTLSSSAPPEVKHICASGLCNLADLRSLRGRVVEEGAVQCLSSLARGAGPKTRRICGIILHTLASSPACRTDLVSKGAVQVLYSLSSDDDPITLHYVASAMVRLALVESNLTRLINESGVIAICNICIRCPTVASSTQLCAAALQLLSQRTIGQLSVVQEGCTPALVTLLRESSDTVTLRYSLAALCNLLRSEDNHLPVIQQGGVQSVIQLCDHDDRSIREACALALFNLSRGEATRDHQINIQAIPAIISLSRMDSPGTQMRCASALCKLAVNTANVPVMVESGVVPAFIEMLKTEHPGIVKHCCSALCCLAHEGSSCVMIAEGAVPYVIQGVRHGDDTTKQACCAVLSIISSHEQCRRQLCAMGALPALIDLAKMNHGTTRLRCAVAFANLSYESTVQGLMVDSDIVPIVADLSSPAPSYADGSGGGAGAGDLPLPGGDEEELAGKKLIHDSSYSEENQLYCAKSLCNLGCHVGSEMRIINQGGVAALMMICMVRAVNQFTKQVCAKALLNLLTEETMEKLMDQDLVSAVSTLAKRPPAPKKDDETLLRVCAELLCSISAHPGGRVLLCQRETSLETVFSLIRSEDPGTQVVVGKITSNLLAFPETQPAAVSAGAVRVLRQMMTLGDPATERLAVQATFLLTGEEAYRRELVRADMLPLLLLLSQSRHREVALSSHKILSNLAYHASTRAPLNENRGVVSIVRAVNLAKDDPETLEFCVFTLAFLLMGEAHPDKHVDADFIGALHKIWALPATPQLHGLLALMLRSVSVSPVAREALLGAGVLSILCGILEQAVPRAAQDSYCAHTTRMATATLYWFSWEPSFDAAIETQPDLFRIFKTLGRHDESREMVIGALRALCDRPDWQPLYVVTGFPNFLLEMAELDDLVTLLHLAHIFFILSKNPKIRPQLADAGLVATLVRLSKSSTPQIRSLCSEALKNFSSSGDQGVEEGTVFTLISMSLHKTDRASSTEKESADPADLVRLPPVIESMYVLPKHIQPDFDPNFVCYTVNLLKHPGGAAGQGPPPPEPPEMEDGHQQEIIVEDDESPENVGEEDGKQQDRIMMFAKMDAGDPGEDEAEQAGGQASGRGGGGKKAPFF